MQKTAKTPAAARPQPVNSDGRNFPFGFSSLPGFAAFAILGILLFLAPYLFSGFWPVSYEYWPQSLFLSLTACACLLWALAPESQIRHSKSKTALFLTLFIAWCAISFSSTVYLHDSLLEFSRIIGVLACFFLARAFLAQRATFHLRAQCLLAAVVAGGVIICVPAILDFLKTRNPRQFATFYNPNLFANYCAMAFPLSIAWWFLLRPIVAGKIAENGWRFVFKLIAICLAASATLGIVTFLLSVGLSSLGLTEASAWWREQIPVMSSLPPALALSPFTIFLGLIVTSSKGGFLAALCAALVFAIAVFRAKGERVKKLLRAHSAAFAVITVVILMAGGFLFSQTILPRLSSNIQNDHSTMFRVYTWAGTWRMAGAHPISGWGAGSFPSAYTQFAETGYTRSAHQSWLQIAAECGFPAMLFLLAACVMAFSGGWKALRGNAWPIAAGSLGALVAFCVHGLTDSGWGIISIGALLMVTLALLETSSAQANEEPEAASIAASQVNWRWLLATLPLALGSWISQQAQTGEDSRTDSRELMSKGLSSSALEKASEARDSDRFSARLLDNFAQAQNAASRQISSSRDDWMYQKIIEIQPTRALNYLNYAHYLMQKDPLTDAALQQLDKAIKFDPNDTEIRLTRGKWKLENKDASGWKDIEYVASLKDKPYGKYPATPEMVDLNFARAYAMLAERDIAKDQSAAKNWISRGLDVIKEGRKWEPQRREMEKATQDRIDESREQAMNELETHLKDLQEKLK